MKLFTPMTEDERKAYDAETNELKRQYYNDWKVHSLADDIHNSRMGPRGFFCRQCTKMAVSKLADAAKTLA
jgi:hypothetical protein